MKKIKISEITKMEMKALTGGKITFKAKEGAAFARKKD